MTENMTDARWFDAIEPSAGDPWKCWVKALGFPRVYDPLHAEIEHAVEKAIEHVDRRRKVVSAALPGIWASFRKRHLELDECWKYRRKRFLVWRAAALTTLLKCSGWDEVDVAMINVKLAETHAEFGPPDYSIWNPKDSDSPLENYAADVLALFDVAIAGRAGR